MSTTLRRLALGLLIAPALVPAFGPALSAAVDALPGLDNAGFEDGYKKLAPGDSGANSHITGAIAAGWSDNSSWADVDVDYAQAKANPHNGESAQSVNIKRFASGAVQFVHPVKFKAGLGLSFSVYLRGRPGQTVTLMLRESGAPWTAYGITTATLSAEWQEFHVRGITAKDEEGMLMIKAGEPMQFEMDDAKLEDLAAISSDAPAKPGNQLTGGSFETAQIPFGWSNRQEGGPDAVWKDLHPAISDGGKVGDHCLRVDLPADSGSSSTVSPVFFPNPNRVHTASVWLKATVAGTGVHLAIDNTTITKDIGIGTEWQRVTFSGSVPFIDWARLRITCQAHKDVPVSLLIDGAMVEEAPEASAEYVGAAPLEVALTLALPGHVITDGSEASAQLAIAPAPPAGATLELSVDDLIAGNFKLPALALPATSVPLPALPGRPHGMFKLRAVVRDAAGKALSAPTELVFARLPKSRDIAPEKSYFGLHIPLTADYIAMARAIGVRWIRFHDTCMIGKWAVAEPEAGKWDFFDTQVDAAHDAGLGIIGMFDGAPARVASKPREGGYWGLWNLPDLPGAIDQWRNYVKTVSAHYHGKIDTWEVWNEPWGQWWSGAGGTPQGYADLMKAAYTEAKAANPAVTVIGVDTYRGNDWTANVLKASGTDCFDAMSFHDYNDAMYGGAPSFAQRQVDTFTAAQAAVGAAKPLWDTEGGLFGVGSWYVPATGGMNARSQVAYAIRYDVTMIAAGVKAYVMYGVHVNGAMGDIECRDDEFDRAVKPVLAARAILAAEIDGAGRPIRSEPQPGVDCYAWPAENGHLVSVWWSYDGGDHSLPTPPGASVLDALGSPITAGANIALGPEPVYVVTAAK